MKNTKIISVLAMISLLFGASSCRHKDLSYEQNRNSRLNVIFDWNKAPDANPASMAFYLYSSENGDNPIRYIFQDNTGGYITTISGNYHALCLNADLTDWAVISGEPEIDEYEISTLDAESLGVTGFPAAAIPRAPKAETERMAKTPGMLWADRLNDIYLPASYDTKTITMTPVEKICHYTVDVYDSGDISLYKNGIDATLSGMAEGYNIGTDKGSAATVTHPFILKPLTSENSLHSEFLTFGDAASQPEHNVSLYMIDGKGGAYNYNVDVTDQIRNARDPRHVHIIIRGVDLPDPGDGGTPMGLLPDVNDWETVNITLKM